MTVTIVGIAGGTGSGKSTLGRRLVQAIGPERCALIAQDNYYHDLSHLSVADRAAVNFDHPDIFDWPLLKELLAELAVGKDIVIPNYNYKTCKRDPPGIVVKATPLVLFEGIFALYDFEILAMLDFNIFVHTDDDLRLLRRL